MVSFVFFVSFFCGCGFFPHTYPGVRFANPSDETQSPDEEIPNSITLNGKKSVDILFVVDTSYSMVPYLEKVNQTFKDFIPKLSPVSWKIAFTNADYDPNAFSYYGRDLFNGKVMRLELNGSILPYNTLHVKSENSEGIFLDTLKRYEHGDISDLSPNQYINPCDLPPYCQGHIRNSYLFSY